MNTGEGRKTADVTVWPELKNIIINFVRAEAKIFLMLVWTRVRAQSTGYSIANYVLAFLNNGSTEVCIINELNIILNTFSMAASHDTAAAAAAAGAFRRVLLVQLFMHAVRQIPQIVVHIFCPNILSVLFRFCYFVL